jgi:hypothetical protein
MTFCLEIQRSTGNVILSHSGPNSIYNHEQISTTFSKSNLDLNQLNFIHISAGTRTIPIRNLFINFEKQPEPLDDIDNNIQSDLSNIHDNNTILSSRIEIVKQPDQSSGTFSLYEAESLLKVNFLQNRIKRKIYSVCDRDVHGGNIFFEDIEKVHEFDRILVFTSETS